MKTVIKRITRLEDRFTVARAERRRIRMVIHRHGQTSLQSPRCSRSLWADGTLFEMVVTGPGSTVGGTRETFETWIASCPIDKLAFGNS
jgi:hypothetical protein